LLGLTTWFSLARDLTYALVILRIRFVFLGVFVFSFASVGCHFDAVTHTVVFKTSTSVAFYPFYAWRGGLSSFPLQRPLATCASWFA